MSLLTKGYRAAALLACLALTGCPGPGATLEIISPSDGETLSLATDSNPGMAGVQTEVVVQASGIAVGDAVDLVVDDVIVTSLPTPEDGVITFTDVTLSPGSHSLRASRAGTIESAAITVNVASDECFAISFVTPAPAGARVTLGPSDDTDGVACGETFETTVVVATAAPEGSSARILVNGAPQRTSTVSGGVARFEGVALDRRTPMENTLAVDITSTEGVVCSQSYPVPVVVDCAGVSCTITSPDAGAGFLNQSHDVSDEPGFQGDFEVTTDFDGRNQPVRLIIDGNETDALSMTADGTVATFGNVALSEGVHRLQAECRDAAGNTSRSAPVEWMVDVTPCPVSIESPVDLAGFIDEDDLDPSTPGIDIDVSGTCGADCTELRVGLCGALAGLPYEPAAASFSERVELGTAAAQQICAQARDAAGNVSSAAVAVRVVTAAPQLEIASPATGTGFNVAGNDGRTADLVAGTEACDARFEVYCTALGTDVEILREGSSTVLASATCVADATVPSPYAGIAVFDQVPLPSVDSGAAYNVIARQTADRLTGTSSPISVFADCAAPQLVVVVPTCGSLLTASLDQDDSTPEIEHRTNVLFGNGRPGDEVTLTIRAAGGGAVTYMESRAFATSPVSFGNASYGAGGELDVIATATDAAGNVGQAPSCTITVEDLPSVTITSPAMGAVLSGADDCDAATPGMQVRVRGTTDAAPGSAISVEVGSETTAGTVGAGGTIDVCASAADGRNVTIRTSVTDARGTGTASLTVVVDTQPPTASIDDLTVAIEDRRGGTVRFSWTAVADAGGLTLTRYEGRCADAPITTEAEWNAATGSTLMTVPGTAGTTQSETLGGLRTGETRHCALRAADPTGALTPLGPSVEVSLPFLTQEVAAPGTAGMGASIVPVGDVNGDGIDDVLAAGADAVYLYFGSASGTLDSSPSVTIHGGSGWGFAAFGGLAGIGDFNGDGLADFAVGSWLFAGLKGAAFVFYGRPTVFPWPSEVSVTASSTTCMGADVCFLGDDGVDGSGPDEGAGLGWSVSAAGDFDGDGVMDLAVGAPGAMGQTGRTYIILGGSGAFPSGSIASVPGSNPDGFVIEGDVNRRQLGNTVSSLGGDLNGDGRHDLLILSGGNSGVTAKADHLAGRAFVGTGLVTIPTSVLDPIGSGPVSVYGPPLCAAGDVNGDGLLDLAITTRNSAGMVTYVLGTTSGFAGASTFTVTNDAADGAADEFGYSVGVGRHPWLGVIGDIDGDRIVDGLFGSKELGAMTESHAHLLYFGAPASNRVRSSGVSFGPFSTSTSVVAAFVGDINGDGYSDIALGDSTDAGRIIIQY